MDIDIKTADIATLARIAATECPALTRKTQGWLGAGTHPAQPYLAAMLRMVGYRTHEDLDQSYVGHDRARWVVAAFVSNAAQWRGENARAIKAELKRRVKG